MSETLPPIPPDDVQLAELLQGVRDGNVAIVTTLLNARPALVNAKDADGQAAIHVAAEHNDARLGAVLVAGGADLNLTMGDSGHTAMSWAVTCNAGDFARALSKLGATTDLFCAAGIGALDDVRAWFDDTGHLRPGASRTGSSRYADDGTRLPCPPESARDQISDALYIAGRNGNADVVRELLACGPDLGFKVYAGGTALHWAYFSGNRAVVAALVAAGADTNRHDNGINASPRAFGICTAASWGFGWLVTRLLKEDPQLARERTADGRNAADMARANGHPALADELDARLRAIIAPA